MSESEEEIQPLSEEEIKRLREILKYDERKMWLLAAVKSVSIWLAAFAAGYLALKGILTDFIVGGPKP